MAQEFGLYADRLSRWRLSSRPMSQKVFNLSVQRYTQEPIMLCFAVNQSLPRERGLVLMKEE